MYIELTREDDGHKFIINPFDYTINDRGPETGAVLRPKRKTDYHFYIMETYEEVRMQISMKEG